MSSQSPFSRRVFLSQVVVGGSAVIAFGAQAQQPAKVDEKDPTALALGYVADTTKADAKKFTKHAKDQKCSGCQLYSGKATDASGPCSVFPGKHVTAAGWCSAWIKKPA
jgi:High potential iron-sulfur protein